MYDVGLVPDDRMARAKVIRVKPTQNQIPFKIIINITCTINRRVGLSVVFFLAK